MNAIHWNRGSYKISYIEWLVLLLTNWDSNCGCSYTVYERCLQNFSSNHLLFVWEQMIHIWMIGLHDWSRMQCVWTTMVNAIAMTMSVSIHTINWNSMALAACNTAYTSIQFNSIQYMPNRMTLILQMCKWERESACAYACTRHRNIFKRNALHAAPHL